MPDPTLLRPADQLGRGGRRVAAAPVLRLDRVPDLDGVGVLLRVHARRPVIPGVPDHAALEDDRERAPVLEPRVLAHLPEPQGEEAKLTFTREPGWKLRSEQSLGLLPAPVQDRLQERLRQRVELDHSYSGSQASSPPSRIGRRSSRAASVSSSPFSKRSEKRARTLARWVSEARRSFSSPSSVRTA